VGTFVLMSIFLNSRFGLALSEAIMETVVLLYGWLRFDVLQGLVRWVSNLFKRVSRTVEYVLYTVDEWLRFRSDESRLTMVLRAVLGVVWFPVGYLIRLYFVTLIEPSINPIKLPLSSLAFKFMLLIPLYQQALAPSSYLASEKSLSAYLGQPLAVASTFAFIIPTLWLVPGACAFFFWEMKENWRLFRANRPSRLKPVAVGRRGETILQLLKPGFHSGTIPRLFSNLRQAERAAYLTGDWRPARTYRQALAEVAKAVQLFVEREFLALLHQSRSWPNQPVCVAQIIPSCNRIRIQLAHAAYEKEPFCLAFEEHAGWLMGCLQEAGWLKHLTAEQRQVMASALTGLYKLAGVDFVREQVYSVLPPQVPGYDITDHQLVVWTGQRNTHEIAYDLRDRRDQLRPRQLNGKRVDSLPPLDARQLFFSRLPLTWKEWVDCWQQDHEGKGHPRLLNDGVLLPFQEPSRPRQC
jgi:hypothetical protein